MRIARGISIANISKPISSAIVYDADAAAFFTAASITDTTQKSAVNTLVLSLKSANIWTKMKALYPVVGGVESAHAVNLKKPGTFNLTFQTGWTHASTGMTPNGATYADTFFTPTIDTDGTSHYSFYSRTNVTALSVVFGSHSIGPNYYYTYLTPRSSAGQCGSAINENTGELFTTPNSLGLFTLNRQNSNDYDVWINSIKQINTNKLSLGRSAFKIYLGALNSNGTASNYSTNQCAFFSAGLPLTDAEASNFYNAVQNYQTTLGRQV